jgi:hypothetical protein
MALDVGGDVKGLDVVQVHGELVAPPEEGEARPEVGLSGIAVPKVSGEEFEKAVLSAGTCGGEDVGESVRRGQRSRSRDELGVHFKGLRTFRAP